MSNVALEYIYIFYPTLLNPITLYNHAYSKLATLAFIHIHFIYTHSFCYTHHFSKTEKIHCTPKLTFKHTGF